VLSLKLVISPSKFYGSVREELAYSFGNLVVFGMQKATMRLEMDWLWGLFCFINNNEPFPTCSNGKCRKKICP
jgi:hypothetical protein